MAKLIELQKSQLEQEPNLIWNSFIQLIVESKTEELSENQTIAQFACLYDSEVQNGGHLQYFENQYLLFEDKLTVVVEKTIEDLKTLGANKYAEILSQAREKYFSRQRIHPSTTEEFCSLELENEFVELDNQYYDCLPGMNYYLKTFLESHMEDFIKFV
jgi:hypothetical protein